MLKKLIEKGINLIESRNKILSIKKYGHPLGENDPKEIPDSFGGQEKLSEIYLDTIKLMNEVNNRPERERKAILKQFEKHVRKLKYKS